MFISPNQLKIKATDMICEDGARVTIEYMNGHRFTTLDPLEFVDQFDQTQIRDIAIVTIEFLNRDCIEYDQQGGRFIIV